MGDVRGDHDPNEPLDWCAWCGAPLPLDRYWGRRKYCSYECGTRHEHALKARERAQARQGRRCVECGGRIPDDRRAGSRYCSHRCGERVRRRRYRRRRRNQEGQLHGT